MDRVGLEVYVECATGISYATATCIERVQVAQEIAHLTEIAFGNYISWLFRSKSGGNTRILVEFNNKEWFSDRNLRIEKKDMTYVTRNILSRAA